MKREMKAIQFTTPMIGYSIVMFMVKRDGEVIAIEPQHFVHVRCVYQDCINYWSFHGSKHLKSAIQVPEMRPNRLASAIAIGAET